MTYKDDFEKNINDEWIEDVLSDHDSMVEMKKIRKNLRMRNFKIIITAIISFAIVLLGIIYLVIPTLEKKYWNPEDNTYELDEWTTDLELTLSTYTELFLPRHFIIDVQSTNEGLGRYDLEIQYWKAPEYENYFIYGNLDKNIISLPKELQDVTYINDFENACNPPYPQEQEEKNEIYQRLSELPDYIQVEAAISFSSDLNMDELIAMNEKLGDNASIGWVGIRHCPSSAQRYPLIGIKPFSGGVVWDGINDDYPYLIITGEEKTAENLEIHFKSLLQFMSDREADGKGIGNINGPEFYYGEILNYVEQNGVNAYGCYVTGKPQVFIELMDQGIISKIQIHDAFIDVR